MKIDYCDKNEFNLLVEDYNSINNKFSRTMIFHVGAGAGFYSEIGAMMECMLYCLVNKIKFTMYADDATFSNGKGWEEFFEPFCELNHDNINSIANYRYKNHYRTGNYVLPNFGPRRWFYPFWLKRRHACSFLTQDLFADFTSSNFKTISVNFPSIGICGLVGDEYANLRKFAMRYNSNTFAAVNKLIDEINLPENFISVHIRGGDKIDEYSELIDVDYALGEIDGLGLIVKNIFVFTDDYRNIELMKSRRPYWNVYTLTLPSERGYYNSSFNKMDWSYRRSNLIKLFSMVEICIKSDFHIGFENACVNGFIKSARGLRSYHGMVRGSFVKKNFSGRLLSYMKSLLRS